MQEKHEKNGIDVVEKCVCECTESVVSMMDCSRFMCKENVFCVLILIIERKGPELKSIFILKIKDRNDQS